MNNQELVIQAMQNHSPKHGEKFKQAILESQSYDVPVLANVCAFVCSENHINADMPNPFPRDTHEKEHDAWDALVEPIIAGEEPAPSTKPTPPPPEPAEADEDDESGKDAEIAELKEKLAASEQAAADEKARADEAVKAAEDAAAKSQETKTDSAKTEAKAPATEDKPAK